MYFARGMRELLVLSKLNLEFFEELDDFQIHFIDMCFKQSLDDKMGMFTEIEYHNYCVFEEYKLKRIEHLYGLDAEYLKKAG